MDKAAISWERLGDITLVRFTNDKISDIVYAKRATDELHTLVELFAGRMLISLGNVKFMSSIGVAILVTFNQQIRAAGGELKVCEAQPLVADIFRSLELDKALDIHTSKADALASFGKRP